MPPLPWTLTLTHTVQLMNRSADIRTAVALLHEHVRFDKDIKASAGWGGRVFAYNDKPYIHPSGHYCRQPKEIGNHTATWLIKTLHIRFS